MRAQLTVPALNAYVKTYSSSFCITFIPDEPSNPGLPLTNKIIKRVSHDVQHRSQSNILEAACEILPAYVFVQKHVSKHTSGKNVRSQTKIASVNLFRL